MKLLTIFISTKPFLDPHIVTIQRNALRSWKALGDEVDVILLGNEEGMAETAAELEIRHIPDVQCNQHGTPLLSSMFDLAREHSDSQLLAYVNADILLFDDFLQQSKIVSQKSEKFLLLGQRWDLDVNEELDFFGDWRSQIDAQLANAGKLHARSGSDYFVYPRACFERIPDFAIGRAGWDNWMIYEARRQNWDVIDCTPSINIIHQNHDYAHLPGGQTHYRLPETAENIRLAGGKRNIFSLNDVNKYLENEEIRKFPLTGKRFWREVEIFPLVKLRSKFLAQLFYAGFHPKKAYVEFRAWLRGE